MDSQNDSKVNRREILNETLPPGQMDLIKMYLPRGYFSESDRLISFGPN